MNADAGHYGAQLEAEVVALRDSVEGWQSAGRPLGGGRSISTPTVGSPTPSRT